jgi:hypothetical protein
MKRISPATTPSLHLQAVAADDELKQLPNGFSPYGADLSLLPGFFQPFFGSAQLPPPAVVASCNSQPLACRRARAFLLAATALQAIHPFLSADMLRGRSVGFHASSDAKCCVTRFLMKDAFAALDYFSIRTSLIAPTPRRNDRAATALGQRRNQVVAQREKL